MKRLSLSLILLCSGALSAAEALTLEHAVELALARAPQVAARTAMLDAANSLSQSAGRLPDPSAIVGVDNLPIEGPDAWSTTADLMTMSRIGLMQEFPAAGKRRAESARAQADARIAGAELAVTQLEVARATAQAWIRRATAADAARALGALEADFTLGSAAARGAMRAGRASSVEALEAETALARFRNRLIQLQGEQRQAEVELERWIGAEAKAPGAPTPAFDALPVAAAKLRESVHLHSSLAPFDLRIEAAREDIERARAARRPDFSVELSYAKRGPAYDDMAALEFRVGLPLFARNRQNPVIAARNAELRSAEAEREAELRMHDAELHHMLVSWESAGEQLEQLTNELLPLSRERSRAALSAYRAGNASLRTALDAFEDETGLLIERATLENQRGSAWAFLRYLEAQHLHPGKEVTP